MLFGQYDIIIFIYNNELGKHSSFSKNQTLPSDSKQWENYKWGKRWGYFPLRIFSVAFWGEKWRGKSPHIWIVSHIRRNRVIGKSGKRKPIEYFGLRVDAVIN